MFIFAGFAYTVLRRTHKRWPAVTYAIMLFFSAVIFIGVAIAFPAAKNDVREQF